MKGMLAKVRKAAARAFGKADPEPLAARRVLFVCMGNICRSPTAEGVFRKLLAERAPELDVQVDSAGTHAYHIGHPPDVRAQRAAALRGVDLSTQRARPRIRDARRRERNGQPQSDRGQQGARRARTRYLVRGKPRSTLDDPGSGQRDVTTLARV